MSKYFKHPDRNDIIEVTNENTVSIYKREGFIEVDDKGQPIDPNSSGAGAGDDEELNELREQAKELGIKNTHNMRKETLIEKIAEATKE